MAATARDAFIARLKTGPFLLDGATGTELMRQGLPAGEAPERWVLDRPAAIRELAAAYAAAGADAVYTCTFGANRLRMQQEGLAGKTREVVERAVTLAREGAGGRSQVFGNLGPIGAWLEPAGELSEDEAAEAFKEQAEALVAAGVDALALETFTDPREAVLATQAARAAAPDLPILVSMTFERAGNQPRTATGATPESVAADLAAAGADVIGVNCGAGPDEAALVIPLMRAAVPSMPLTAKPNAGLPVLSQGRLAYAIDAETFGRAMAALAGSGVRVIGGCCGTTPDHLRALARALGRPERS